MVNPCQVRNPTLKLTNILATIREPAAIQNVIDPV
jgi:hypothetical protein